VAPDRHSRHATHGDASRAKRTRERSGSRGCSSSGADSPAGNATSSIYGTRCPNDGTSHASGAARACPWDGTETRLRFIAQRDDGLPRRVCAWTSGLDFNPPFEEASRSGTCRVVASASPGRTIPDPGIAGAFAAIAGAGTDTRRVDSCTSTTN